MMNEPKKVTTMIATTTSALKVTTGMNKNKYPHNHTKVQKPLGVKSPKTPPVKNNNNKSAKVTAMTHAFSNVSLKPANEHSLEAMNVDKVALAYADEDGASHINVNITAATELGRLLSHFSFSPFVHPYYGPFNGMEGFWYYIMTKEKDETLRTLTGANAKYHGKTLTHQHRPNFKEIIIAANFFRIEQNPKLKQLILESELPFDHYYLFGEGKNLVRPRTFDWLVHGFETIRWMLKHGKRPDAIQYQP